MTALVVRPLAEADLDETFAWYEAARSAGVDFLRAVDACFAAIEATPLAYPVVYRGARRALLRRFPYAILYLLDGERLHVLACTHTSLHPRRWRQRA
ncbi:MAG: type II toxin-antitoxin system RelE/ParE family toxin [Gemmatimonadetes bacterium]|nr:type II toxin-antitoxin system RelE/ParE family toxin [Gemmatimonadota bacterium]